MDALWKKKKSMSSAELSMLRKRPQDAQPHNLLCVQRGLGALPSNKQMQSGSRFALLADLSADNNAPLSGQRKTTDLCKILK
jgi:hypothetical protein